jgi:hypothetical protein
MPRYKTLFAALCENGHAMLVEDRRVSASKESAQRIALELRIPSERCKQYNAPIRNGRVIGTEDIGPAKYTVFGYTCECGEQVEVYRMEDNLSYTPPPTYTSTCSKGHSRTMTSMEALSLPRWREEPN